MAKKKYRFTFTLRSLVFWVTGSFIIIIWVFILGILVGRGDLSFVRMKDKLAGIHGIINGSPEQEAIETMDSNLKLEFYDELVSKKEAAAQKGRTPPAVKAQAPKPKTVADKATVKTAALPKNIRGYVLQIGSFRDKAKATSFARELTDQNYPAFLSNAEVDGKAYYRVKCGPFKTEAKADAFKKILAEKKDIHGFVTRTD